jgi:hypothetical protein
MSLEGSHRSLARVGRKATPARPSKGSTDLTVCLNGRQDLRRRVRVTRGDGMGGYTPGVATAPALLVIALYLGRQLRTVATRSSAPV